MELLMSANPKNVYNTEMYKNALNYRECQRQLRFLANSSMVIPFIDSSARIPSGLLSLNVNDYGDYYQCLKINKHAGDMHLEGKYCFIRVPIIQNITMPTLNDLAEMTKETVAASGASLRDTVASSADKFIKNVMNIPEVKNTTENQIMGSPLLNLGVCIPKVCSVNQVSNFMNTPLLMPQMEYMEGPCRLPGDKFYATADYIAFAVFGILLFFTFLSTCYDLYQVHICKKTPKPALISLSLNSNIKRFLKINPPKDSLNCVDGIRAISMLWVICGHSFYFEFMSPGHNLLDMIEWTTYFSSTWINAAPMVVDTFFMLSGLFCVYVLPKSSTPVSFLKSLPMFYLYRYLRTLPLLAVAVLLQASVFNWIADGPDWDRMAYCVDGCRQGWWATLLHIQNLIHPIGVCVFQTWYLTVDMQLYFLSPIIIIFLVTSATIAWTVLSVAFVGSLAALAYYCYEYKYPSVLNGLWYSREIQNYYVNFYINTATRASPFIVGMMFGYILWRHRGKGMTFSKQRVIFFWTAAMLAMGYCFFTIYCMVRVPYQFTYYDMVFNCIMRATWAAGVGWMVMACAYGYGGPIDWFLSLPIWKVLSKVSYAVYLIHVQIVLVDTVGIVKPRYFTEIDTLYACASYILLSLIISFILCVVVDVPASTLLKVLFVRKRPKRVPRAEPAVENVDELKTKL